MKSLAPRDRRNSELLSSTPLSESSTIRWRTLLIFLALLTFSCVVVYQVASPALPLSFSAQMNLRAPVTTADIGATEPEELRSTSFSAPPPVPLESESEDDSLVQESEDELVRVLKAAAMEDNTVILTTLNAAWAAPGSILDQFLESFRIGNGTSQLLKHLVIIVVDQKAYNRCETIHPHCYALITEGVDFSGEKSFMSADYLTMMWNRLDFLRLVLEKGFNFIFSDVDIMWFRNPLPVFYPDGDFQIACDDYKGDPTDLKNWPNNGFNYVKSNNRSIAFYKHWVASRARFPTMHEQNVLNEIKYEPYITEIGVRIRFLSTENFGGFCQPSEDFRKVCTMHANCCYGLTNKLHDLKAMLKDWSNYMALPPDEQISGHHSWSVPQSCRWGPPKKNNTKV